MVPFCTTEYDKHPLTELLIVPLNAFDVTIGRDCLFFPRDDISGLDLPFVSRFCLHSSLPFSGFTLLSESISLFWQKYHNNRQRKEISNFAWPSCLVSESLYLLNQDIAPSPRPIDSWPFEPDRSMMPSQLSIFLAYTLDFPFLS